MLCCPKAPCPRSCWAVGSALLGRDPSLFHLSPGWELACSTAGSAAMDVCPENLYPGVRAPGASGFGGTGDATAAPSPPPCSSSLAGRWFITLAYPLIKTPVRPPK